IFTQHDHLYNTVQYNVLNEHKCEKILYLLFCEAKAKLGLIAGLKDGVLTSPFSAPFGGFSSNKNSVRVEVLYEAIQLLDNYAKQNGISAVKFILSPYFYNEDLWAKTHYSLNINGYTAIKDINYHLNSSDFPIYKENKISKRTKEYIDKAISHGLIFKQVTNDHDKRTAFKIIKDNRDRKDRPMYIDYNYILEVSKIIPIDFFLILDQNIPIASAIAYHISKHVLQIVFWGNVCDHDTQIRPMYFLAFKLFEFYHTQQFKTIDLTTGSVNGVPNFGLCHFKENIGCTAGLKLIMQKSFL
ncbi:MAG TPA: hypothetical protein VI413_04185, partial [Paludibacter sp.]